MVSVCLCTYNGEKSIERQIKSILAQSVIPDEMVIFDDMSTDNTVDVIKHFIFLFPKIKWKLHVRKNNVGWKRNFHDAINYCTGDYIFLCDQDDFWYSYKIRDMTKIMDENKKIMLLSSNFYYEIEGQVSKRKMVRYDRNVTCVPYKNKKSVAAFNPGCTYCFRKELIGDFNRLWKEGLAHDRVLWCLASLKDGLYLYNRPCINWIRTGFTASTVVESHFSKNRFIFKVNENKLDQIMAMALIELSKEQNNQKKEKYYHRYFEKVCLQQKLYQTGKIIYALKLLFKIHWYHSFKSYLQDLIAFRYHEVVL